MTVFDTKTIQKLAQYDLMKSERDFYFNKQKDVDHIIDVYKDTNVDSLIQAIKEILYLPPEKIAMISDEGNVLIKSKNEEEDVNRNCFASKELMNFNFLDDQNDNQNFNFDDNLNLMNDDDKLDLDANFN